MGGMEREGVREGWNGREGEREEEVKGGGKTHEQKEGRRKIKGMEREKEERERK